MGYRITVVSGSSQRGRELNTFQTLFSPIFVDGYIEKGENYRFPIVSCVSQMCSMHANMLPHQQTKYTVPHHLLSPSPSFKFPISLPIS